jgi:hypothetical protein
MLVSHKRTRNLFDLTSLWKHTVLLKLDEDASDPDNQPPANDADPDIVMSDSDMSVSDQSDGIDPNFFLWD